MFQYYLYGFKLLSNYELNILDVYSNQIFMDVVTLEISLCDNNCVDDKMFVSVNMRDEIDELELNSNIKYRLDYNSNIIFAQAITLEQIQSTLLNLPFALFLVRKQMLLLHGSGFICNNHLIPICAPKGSGKTTLVSAIVKKRYPFFSDDTIAICLHERIVGYSGANCLKLTETAYEALQLHSENCDLRRNIQNKIYLKPPDKWTHRTTCQPIDSIIVIQRENSKKVSLNKVSNTFNKKMLLHFNICGTNSLGYKFCDMVEKSFLFNEITDKVVFYKIIIPNNLEEIEKTADDIAEICEYLTDV